MPRNIRFSKYSLQKSICFKINDTPYSIFFDSDILHPVKRPRLFTANKQVHGISGFDILFERKDFEFSGTVFDSLWSRANFFWFKYIPAEICRIPRAMCDGVKKLFCRKSR